MKRTALLALLSAVALASVLAADAQAVYHPRLGRFLQRDPAGYADGAGLYSYCRTNPVRRVDPMGDLSAQHAGSLPTIKDCRAAWWGVWITPNGEQTPGSLVIRWTQAWIIWDCQGAEIGRDSRTKHYYLPVNSNGKAGDYRLPDGGRDYSGEWKKGGERADPFFHVVLWENQSTGPGGRYKGDCTEGVLSVKTVVRYYSLNPGFEETAWQQGGFKEIPRTGKNPSDMEVDPQRPGAYRSDNLPQETGRGPPSGDMTFTFFYYWNCCDPAIERLVMYEPSDLSTGDGRPLRERAVEDRGDQIPESPHVW
jgi:hypothetical protein